MISRARRARPAAARRAALIGFAGVLAACGRISLGSQDPLDAGQGGSAGAAAAGAAGAGVGGAGAAGAGVGGAGVGGAAGVAGAPDPGGGGGATGGSPAGGAGALPPPSDAGPFDDAGPRPLEPPSCRRELPRCGVGAGDDCCAAPLVPGGAFALTADESGRSVAVSVSSYRLDRFEVSVGRAREFVASYDDWRASGEPRAGLGRHPRIEGSGWQDDFTPRLPATAADLEQRWASCGMLDVPLGTYSAGGGTDAASRVPLDCATWFEAFAFCAWDGGRLPTLAELQFAGAGGDENRLYPWGDTPPPNAERAAFGCMDPELQGPECFSAPTWQVGARPLGVGRFGQDDLAGSMSEWLLDGVPTISEPCADCASLIDVSSRSRRGGSWFDGADALVNGAFSNQPPEVAGPFNGIRCARDD